MPSATTDAATRPLVAQRLARHAVLIVQAATHEHLDPWLLAGVAAHESHGNPYAIRVERGYWRRYAAGLRAAARRTLWTSDDRWIDYPDLAACSYGLCQIMFGTALQYGAHLDYPTELCDPTLNLYLAARILADLTRRHPGDLTAQLLAWNGGGNRAYPGLVLAWHRFLRSTDDFPDLDAIRAP